MSRDYIQFLLDGELITERRLDPTMSVLTYLRERKMRTGTKEGCAEGDCGACTIALGELKDGKTVYKSINACIVFVPVLDGKEILTIESLGRPDHPHRLQKIIAEKHASQCGFCTPGIVMSLYCLQLSGLSYDQSNIEEALAGNLCRCTGYGPIIDAAKNMGKTRKPRGIADKLAGLAHDDLVHLSANIHGQDKQFFIPKTIEQLAEVLEKHPEATLLSGGTDIGLWVTKHHMVLETVIYLGNIPALDTIEKTDNAYIIGAGVVYDRACAALGVLYPDMDTVIRRIGAQQIRNLGTIGGNIANGSPIGDMPPLLIAAGAELVLQKGAKARTIKLEDFFLDYGKQDLAKGEFVRSIIVPKISNGQSYFAYKISKRFESDISALCMGMSFDSVDRICANVRIAFGGMAATPKRATNAEAALEGQIWSEDAARAAMAALEKDFAPISDMRASKDYRMQVAKNLILKAWLETFSERPLQVLEHEFGARS